MLNEKQEEAVNTIKGPVAIRAGAGCGKTLTITHRVVNMIKEGINPSEILLITFTKAAAEEMKKRTAKLLNEMGNFTSINKMQISTFHSFARKTIMEYLNYSPLKNIKNLKWSNDSLSEWYLKQILTNYLKQTGDQIGYKQFSSDISGLLRMISDVKEAKKSLKDFTKEFEIVYKLFNNHLISQGKVDFSGSLFYLNKLLENEEVRKDLENRYKYVMVDEFQDSNKRMFSILTKLTKKNKNLCVVGDENQSIFGFNGSTPEFIIDFKKYYPNAKIILLNENYRSTSQILNASNNLISHNENPNYNFLKSFSNDGRVDEKKYRNAKEQAEKIAEEIIWFVKKGEKPEDIAILARTNMELNYFLSVIKNKKNADLFRKKTVTTEENIMLEHIVEHLKLIFNYTTDDDVFEILTKYNGMFHYTLRNLFLKAKKKDPAITAFKFLGTLNKNSEIPKYVYEKIKKFYNFFNQIISVAKLNEKFIKKFLDLLPKFVDKVNDYEKISEKYNTNKTAVKYVSDDGKELLRIMERNEIDYSNIYNFFSKLDKILEEEDMPKDKITLLTIHTSKGLEWKHIYILNFIEDCIPFKNEFDHNEAPFYFGRNLNQDYSSFLKEILEEERRLCYVAITRAKKRLSLCYPEYKYEPAENTPSGWKSVKTELSRFLKETKEMKRVKSAQ